MNTLIIIVIAIAVTIAFMIFNSIKEAGQADETPQEPSFQPRKITIVNNEVVEKPKRRYKRRTKKKASPVTPPVTPPVAKKAVGRPKKSN